MEKNVFSFEGLSPPNKSPVQLTVKYLNSLEKQKGGKNSVLMYYMACVKQDENKTIDLVFVEKLINEGVDVNYADDLDENALFKVFESKAVLEFYKS